MIKSTRKNKKKKSIKTKINWIISITLMIFLPIAYVHKRQMLKESGVTICKIVGQQLRPGSSAFRGKQVIVEYFVDGQHYENIEFEPSVPYAIGDCFKLKYSLEKPRIADVLWDEGKQPCMSE